MTNTCAGYVVVEPGTDPRTILRQNIWPTNNWPFAGNRDRNAIHIPTIVAYSPKPNQDKTKGAFDISIGFEAEKVEKESKFKANSLDSEVVVVRNFKLLLDPRPQTAKLLGEKEEGVELRKTLQRAKDLGYIHEDLDVVRHFDSHVFSHCVAQMRNERTDFNNASEVLVAVALPYEWVDVSAQEFVTGLERALSDAGVRNPLRFVRVLPFNESQASAEGVLGLLPSMSLQVSKFKCWVLRLLN